MPSVHAASTGVCVQPVAGLHASVVHASVSPQSAAVPPQAPFVQTSDSVQASPSLQVVALGTGGWLQVPVVVSHVPMAWH